MFSTSHLVWGFFTTFSQISYLCSRQFFFGFPAWLAPCPSHWMIVGRFFTKLFNEMNFYIREKVPKLFLDNVLTIPKIMFCLCFLFWILVDFVVLVNCLFFVGRCFFENLNLNFRINGLVNKLGFFNSHHFWYKNHFAML